MHYVAVAAEHQIEIEFFCGVESLDPVVRIGVAHERGPAVERIACDDYFFVGEEDEDVAIGVSAACQRISTVRGPWRRIRLRSKVMVGRVTCMDFSSAK